MTDRQIIQNAQEEMQYGRFVDVTAAFNKGYLSATRGGTMPTSNTIGAVKNDYENRLRTYLNNLPDSVDLASTPDEYRSSIQGFLTRKKQEYVILANQMDDHVVGSEMYMHIKDQMDNIGGSFKNLANQMKIYGDSKAKIIGDIENQSTSLSLENQANVNLLRGIYNEEYGIDIDDYGNVSFNGTDGSVALNDLPGYELKDYKAATMLTNAATSIYKSGQVLKKGGIMYNDTRNKLRIAIDSGGRNTLMSLIHDGLVGDRSLVEDPYIARNLQAYYEGSLSFEGLRDLVVDNYMDVLVETSKTGYRVKQSPRAARGGNKNGKDNTGASRTISYDGMQLTPKQAQEFVKSRNPLEFNAILNDENIDKAQKAAKMDELAIKMGLSFDDVYLDGKMPEKSYETGGKSDFNVTEYFLNKNK
jgi:hypothetical protein